jgi:DNA repair exonuclease SbcCD ATPase subunit
MLRFNKISIEGFRSFEQDQVFIFPKKENGFYLVTGENRVEPKLGANGCGKSTLFESICWTLYGKTSRGLRGKELANRKDENLTSVCLEFEIGGELYGVTRSWNPNSLVIDRPGKPTEAITQEELVSLVGLSYSAFLNTVLLGQFNQFFLDLSPTEKLEVLSEFLELEVWEKAASTSKDQASELKSRITAQELELVRAEDSFKSLRDQVDYLQKLESVAAEEKTARLAKLRKKIVALESNLEDTIKNRRLLAASISEAKEELEKKDRKLLGLSRQQAGIIQTLQEIRNAYAALDHRQKELSRKLGEIDSINATCPLCRQVVLKDQIVNLLQDLESDNKQIHTKAKELKILEQGNQAKLSEMDVFKKDIEKAMSIYREHIVVEETKLKAIGDRKKQLESDIEELLSELGQLSSKENPHTEKIAQLTENCAAQETRIKSIKSTIQQLRDGLNGYDFWISKFKELRLWILESALADLELHMNNALEELGLIGYRIKIDVERPKADGSGVVKGFTVLITSPEDNTPIIWESWSGGETQRLRLAGAIGFSDMICDRIGIHPSFEVWDEASTHLSEEGIEDLVELLETRSQIRNKQVFLIDHRTINAGNFDDVISVIRDGSGSRILPKEFTRTKRIARASA